MVDGLFGNYFEIEQNRINRIDLLVFIILAQFPYAYTFKTELRQSVKQFIFLRQISLVVPHRRFSILGYIHSNR